MLSQNVVLVMLDDKQQLKCKIQKLVHLRAMMKLRLLRSSTDTHAEEKQVFVDLQSGKTTLEKIDQEILDYEAMRDAQL